MNILNSPIFILGCHKSGTSLLKSLLDGHPDLTVLPSETHFFQYSGYWVDYELRRNTNLNKTIEKQTKGLLQFFKNENRIIDPYAPSNMNGKYDELLFMESIKKSSPSTPPELFSTYLNSIYYSLTKRNIPKNTRIVEKSVENSAFSHLLKSWYPNCKFIHIVRNPYATITAIRKMKSENGFPFLGPILRSMCSSYYDLYRNQCSMKDYLVIKYEDLINNPQYTLSKIIEHLEIDHHNNLVKPTLLGKQWTGNSTSNEYFSGISKAPLKRWEKEITDIEISLTNRYLEPVFNLYNYNKKHTTNKYYFKPKNKENLRNFILNRCLIYSSSPSLF